MTKISNESIYGNEDPISENDFIIGTDGDSIAKKTKTFKFGEIRSFVNSGLEPIVGGTLAITNYNYSGVLTTPEAVINQLFPNKTIMPYEVFVIGVNGNKYITKLQNRVVGDTQTPTVAGDYITIYTNPDGSETKIFPGSNISLTGTGTTAAPYVIGLATTAVSALEKINEGNGDGIVIRGRVAANYGNVGLNAIDLTFSTSASSTKGATGESAFAVGRNAVATAYSIAIGSGFDDTGAAKATGANSIAIGTSTLASAGLSHAIGYQSTASGNGSMALNGATASGSASLAIRTGGTCITSGNNGAISIGGAIISSGDYSVTLGNSLTAKSFAETVLGYNADNDIVPSSPTAWVATDRLLVIGNGNGSVSSNALIILKNGLASLPSVTNALISAGSVKSIVTKEYLTSVLPDGSETKITSSATATITGNGTIATPYQVNVAVPPSTIHVTTVVMGGVSTHTGFNMATGIPVGATIISAIPFLRCIVAINGYSIGDIVSVSPPQASDGGGLADSGIGVKFRADTPGSVIVTVNSDFDVNTAYNGVVGSFAPIANPVRYTNWTNWSINIVITYTL